MVTESNNNTYKPINTHKSVSQTINKTERKETLITEIIKLFCCNVATYENNDNFKNKAYQLLDKETNLQKIGSDKSESINIQSTYEYNGDDNVLIDIINQINQKLNLEIEYLIKINVIGLSSKNIIDKIYKITKNSLTVTDITDNVKRFARYWPMVEYVTDIIDKLIKDEVNFRLKSLTTVTINITMEYTIIDKQLWIDITGKPSYFKNGNVISVRK